MRIGQGHNRVVKRCLNVSAALGDLLDSFFLCGFARSGFRFRRGGSLFCLGFFGHNVYRFRKG